MRVERALHLLAIKIFDGKQFYFKLSVMNVDLVAELNLARQQTEEYKSKYFQCLKDIENKNKEIEGYSCHPHLVCAP